MTERISERVLYQRLAQQKHQTDCFDAAKRLIFRASDNAAFPSSDLYSYLENCAFRAVRHVGDFFSLQECCAPSTLLACALMSDLVNRGIYTYDDVSTEFRSDFRKTASKSLTPETREGLEGVVGDFTRMCLRGAAVPPPFIDYYSSPSTYQSRVSNQLRRLESASVESCAIALSNAVVLSEDIVNTCEVDGALSVKTKIVQDYLRFAKKFDLKYFVSELEKSCKILDNTLAVELRNPGSSSDLEGIDLEHL